MSQECTSAKNRGLRVIGVWFLRIFALLIGLTLLEGVVDMIFPAGFDTASTEKAYALISENSSFLTLPESFALTIDEVRAEFRKGDKSYDTMVKLIQHGRTQDMLDASGGRIALGGPKCGELEIRSYGITTRFPIARTEGNQNLYSIHIPHLRRGGYAIPFFTADPRVIDLVKAVGKAQAGEVK